MARFLIVLLLLLCAGCSQSPAPLSTYGASAGAGSSGVHTVSEGDTLYGISKRYKVDVPELALANNLVAPYHLNVGQRLRLPPPEKYEVRPDDSLSEVARLFNVSQSRLAELNNLSKPYRILAGEKLSIPRLRGIEGEIASVMVTPLAMEAAPAHRSIRSAELKDEHSQSSASNTVNILKLPDSYSEKEEVKTPAFTLSKNKPSRFLRPVAGSIISDFGPKKNGLQNDGINIAAPKGATVISAADGEVVYAGNGLKGYGNLILIKHGGRYLTAYGHLGQIHTKKGSFVKAGEKIGIVGTSGQVSSPQLHFEIRKGTDSLDPKKFI